MASHTGLEIFEMRNSDSACADAAQGRLATGKTRWKTSAKGNPFLSFYGLRATVFPNERATGRWTVSVSKNDEPPSYSNYATEPEARATAELKFRELKASGEFKAPPLPPPPPLSELLKTFPTSEGIPAELEGVLIELDAQLEREGQRADLFRLSLNDDGRTALYWVPHSQGALVGYGRLIVTRWWLARAEAVP